ncbi:MAG: ATP-binding protein [Pseudomonadota bacterium]
MIDLTLEQVWTAIPYPAFVVGSDSRIAACNTEAEVFSAASRRQIVDRPLARFVGPESPILDAVAQAREGAASVVLYGVEVGWAERATHVFTVRASLIQESGGAVLLLLHPRGIADQMDRSLSNRSAARSVTGMAAMLAHEIKNPLAGISGAAQLLSMSVDDKDVELTDLIQQEAARITGLVDRVEQFGELRPLNRTDVNIHDVLDRAQRAAAAGYARHVRFRQQYDPSLPPTLGDADQLMQDFQNLLKNAAEAVPEVGGMITLRTGYQPGVKLALPGGRTEKLPLIVSVIDNGRGVPENLIRDIFDPFVSSKANGSGLGLSLVSKVLTDHGGVIECESVPGRTEFRVRLPIQTARAEKETP